MRRLWNRLGILAALCLLLGLAACSQNPMQSTVSGRPSASLAPLAAAGSTNGIAGAESAYYDSMLFKINLMELSDKAAQSVLAHNPSFNIIYEMDEIEGGEFVDVIDAVPGDGMNPLWREVGVEFNPGFTPHQFFSDDEVIEASQGENPEITLVVTDEVYRCSVIGKP